jgi:predicted flap endonuclease-1-like 5' DNA nuclease
VGNAFTNVHKRASIVAVCSGILGAPCGACAAGHAAGGVELEQQKGAEVSYKIQDIEGIGPSYGERLAKAGITTTAALLKACAQPKGRKATAEQTGFSESQLLKWTNMADLMRISGVGEEYSELLEAAGVDTVKELRNRNPDNLAVAMAEVNAKKKLVRLVPSAKSVTKWVAQAKELPPAITY